MAARRLAISSLLCSDDPPQSSPLASPPSPLPSSSSSAHQQSPIQSYRTHEYRLSASSSDIGRATTFHDANHDPSRDVVPMSLQPVQARRHTPPPRSAEYARTSPSASARGLLDRTLYREENRGEALGTAAYPNSGYEYADSSSQRQHLLAESPPSYPSSRRISDPYQRQPHSPQNLPFVPARPSSSRSAQSDPTSTPYSYTQQLSPRPLGHSPSRSPGSTYSLPLPPRHPSHSPVLSSRPIPTSPVNRHYAVQQGSPTHPSLQQPFQSPEALTPVPTFASASSLSQKHLPTSHRSTQPRIFPVSYPPHSLSDTVASPHGNTAMSLPTIIHKTSPVLSPSGGDFGGLEALVQAATEERRRLSGEAGGAGLSRREVSPSTSRSPVLLRGSPHLEVPTQLYAPRSPTLLGVGQADLRLDGPDVRTNYSSPRSERGWDGEPAMKRRRTSGGDTRAIADSRYPISPVGSSTLSPQASTIPTMQFTRETSMGVLASPSDSIRRQPHSPRVVDVPTLGDSGKNRLTTADVADASQTGRDVVTKKSGTGHHKDRESGERKPSQEKKKRSEGSAVKKKEPKLAADQEVIKGDTRRAKETGMANQDPHEWLLEHYSTSSPRPPKRPLSPGDDKIRPVTSLPPERPPQTDATEENTKEAAEARTPSRPSVIKKKPKKLRSPTRTPSPLAILEQELDGAEASSPALGKLDDAEVNLELDLAISMTPDAGTTTRDDPMDLDVEDELLSLVDDGPRASYSRPAPKASPARPRAESAQPGKLSANTTPARPLAASRTGSERGSMPPPLAVSPAQAKNGTLGGPTKDEPTEGANTLNGAKKKDGAKKPPAKPKQPAKPKAKPAPSTTKPKAKGSKDTAPAAPSPAPGTLTAAIPPAALKGKKGSPLPGSGAMGHKRALSATITPARSRSASVMPGASVPPEVDGKGDQGKENTVDDKLYCVCKTNYDEDRVMIACDRCDEWYHTQCVNMPDLEVDLVDQFICPPCVQSNPHLSLSTTYKRRCLAGSKHPNPASPEACHKPARGILSKYCSDECGLAYMQARIDAWTGDKHRLWESVKDAEKREGIVVRAVAIAAPMNGITKPEDSSEPPAARPQSDLPVLEAVKASKTRIERELARLHDQLERLTWRRDQLKKNMEIVLWREKLVQLATARAEALDECGWDQRLCFGDEEYTEFGAGVLESYEEQGQDTKENGDAMEVDGATNEEGEWWCRGKRKCDRHLGWQKLRAGEVEFDKEAMEAAVLKLTTQEREIRKQIEDVTDPQARASATALSTSPLQLLNCKVDLVNLEPPIVKINGDTGKKGKKKKN